MSGPPESSIGSRRTQIIVLAVLAAIIVVISIVISQSGSDDGSSPDGGGGSGEVAKMLEGIPQDGVTLGEADAPATVVEFADLQCPFCGEFARKAFPDVVDQRVRSGDIRYELRLISFLGQDSKEAAQVAAAATLQNKLFDFAETFYLNQGEENSGYVTDAFLTSIAKGAGVKDLDKWNSDRSDNSKWDPLLSKNDSDAKSLGFTGTPSILVEGPGGKKPFTTIPTVAQIEAAVKSVS